METSPDGAPTEPHGPPTGAPLPSQDLLRDALAEEQDEVRRRIDAGASSPEDLRALAALIREQREREATVWASEVKPGLVTARKARLRFGDLRREGGDHDRSQRSFLLVAGVVALVALVLLAAMQLSFLVLLVPVVGLLGYAWWLGTHPAAADAAENDGVEADGVEADEVDPPATDAPTA